MKSALLIVDVQNDFCPGGSLAVEGGDSVAAAITEHVRNIGHEYDHIIASKDWHIDPGQHWSNDPDYIDSWPEHCKAESWGSEFHPWLNVEIEDTFYKGKHTAAYSAFEGTTPKGEVFLDEWLRINNVSHLYICGIALDYCVNATLVDATKLGYITTLLPRLTVSVDAMNHDERWRRMQRETKCAISVR